MKTMRVTFPVVELGIPVAHVRLAAAAVFFEFLEEEGLMVVESPAFEDGPAEGEVTVSAKVRRRLEESRAFGPAPEKVSCPACGELVTVVDGGAT